VLAFQGLLDDSAKTERVKACLTKLDKTYLLDFLSLFGLQQQNGRTFNRRHSPASLVAALLEYLNSPGERYLEVHKIITSKERPVRSNRSTATLNEDQDEEFEDEVVHVSSRSAIGRATATTVRNGTEKMPERSLTKITKGGGGDSHSEEEEEEWGVPEVARFFFLFSFLLLVFVFEQFLFQKKKSGSAKKRRVNSSADGKDNLASFQVGIFVSLLKS
jgi:hypothetical protein